MASSDYRAALQKIHLAADQITNGLYDTARTVLNSASHYGDLDRPEHLEGRLQHDALQALLLLKDRGNLAAASNQLREVVRQIPRVRGNRAQASVWQYCNFVMASFPHVVKIQDLLAKALKEAQRRQYEAAYKLIQEARELNRRDPDLTPQAVRVQISTTADQVMTHLLKNLPAATAIATVAYLREQGLIQE